MSITWKDPLHSARSFYILPNFKVSTLGQYCFLSMTKFRPIMRGWKTRTGIILCRVEPSRVVLTMKVNKRMHMFNWVRHLEFLEECHQHRLSIACLAYFCAIRPWYGHKRCQRAGGNMSKRGRVYLTVGPTLLFMRSRDLEWKAPHSGMQYRCFSVFGDI